MNKLIQHLVINPNKWYDRQVEPYRFIYLAVPVIAIISIISSTVSIARATENMALLLIPLFLFISLILAVFWRVFYLSISKKGD